MSINDIYNQREVLEDQVSNLSTRLNEFPRNEIGLVADNVKNTENYQQTKRSYDVAFRKLQMFNSSLTRNQKLQLRDMKKYR